MHIWILINLATEVLFRIKLALRFLKSLVVNNCQLPNWSSRVYVDPYKTKSIALQSPSSRLLTPLRPRFST